jgi:hypothetical protein
MSLTCVSAYFPVKGKHPHSEFVDWFKNTLSINLPYVFFTNKETMELIKGFRKDLPTHFIECEIEDFYTYKYKERMISDSYHSPSVEVNLIWNEKIIMLQKANDLNPFNTEWFKWIDAGICVFRDKTTFKLNQNLLENLPTDKFIFSHSDYHPFNEAAVSKTNYYHYIAGTSFVLHKNFVTTFVDLYKIYLENLIDKNNIWTEQVILTHIYTDYSDLFFKLGNDYGMGYGKLSLMLLSE